ncbi:MAG: hypothetical protein RLZ42_710 [Armatimonadota bacterium]
MGAGSYFGATNYIAKAGIIGINTVNFRGLVSRDYSGRVVDQNRPTKG